MNNPIAEKEEEEERENKEKEEKKEEEDVHITISLSSILNEMIRTLEIMVWEMASYSSSVDANVGYVGVGLCRELYIYSVLLNSTLSYMSRDSERKSI